MTSSLGRPQRVVTPQACDCSSASPIPAVSEPGRGFWAPQVGTPVGCQGEPPARPLGRPPPESGSCPGLRAGFLTFRPVRDPGSRPEHTHVHAGRNEGWSKRPEGEAARPPRGGLRTARVPAPGAGAGPTPCCPRRPLPEGRLGLATRPHRADRGRRASRWGSRARGGPPNRGRREGPHRGRCMRLTRTPDMTRRGRHLASGVVPQTHPSATTLIDPFLQSTRPDAACQPGRARPARCPRAEAATEMRSLDTGVGGPWASSGTGRRRRARPVHSRAEFGGRPHAGQRGREAAAAAGAEGEGAL